MKQQVLEKLKELLASKTKEQFDREWAEIEAMGLEGPTVQEVLNSFSADQPNAIKVSIKNDVQDKDGSLLENNYAEAS